MQERSLCGKLANKQPKVSLVNMQYCFIYKAIYNYKTVTSR